MNVKRKGDLSRRNLLSRILCLSILFMVISSNLSFVHAVQTQKPDASDITVTNNAGTSDIVHISNLSGGETIKIYNTASGGRPVSTRTVPLNSYEISISILQLGSDGGNIYITLTAKGEEESDRTPVSFDGEPQTSPLDASNIYVENNAGMADSVVIQGLYGGEIIRVYSAKTGGKLLGMASNGKTKMEATVTVTQLGVEAGKIYVTVAVKGERESTRTEVDFDAELVSDKPKQGDISVANNVGIADTVQISGLSIGDRVKVYDATGKRLLGSASLPASKTEATVTVSQLGKAGGEIYVSVINKGKRESDKTKVTFDAEAKTKEIDAECISVTNNSGAPDIVYIYGLEEGDVVKVYNAETGGRQLAAGTVSKSKSDITLSIPQVGNGEGTLYLTKMKKGEFESARVAVAFDSEPRSAAIDSSNITVTNNAGGSDTVYVGGLASGDTVKVYNQEKGGKLLQTATVSGSNTELTMNIPQLGTTSGAIYLTVTNKGSVESARTAAYFSGESTTTAPSESNITITNNALGTSDIINVVSLNPGDIVKVYSASTGGVLLGKATVSSSGTEATITLSQTNAAGGSLYISVTGKGMSESTRTPVAFGAESGTVDPVSGDITVTNNPAGTADTVYVTGVSEGDTIRVYDSASGGKLLKYATVAANATDVTVTITQLGSGGGTVYVSVTGKGKIESGRIAAGFAKEPESGDINADSINVANNVGGTADTVEVVGLTAGDIIKVYDGAKGGKLLGTATVPEYGTYVTISITKLETAGGTIYVSKTGLNKLESGRTLKSYPPETSSQGLTAAAITVTNNAAGTPDKVEVTGLNEGDVIKVYNAQQGGRQLGTATVSSGASYVTVSIEQLGVTGGTVYVSVTSVNKLESARIGVSYSEEYETADLPDGRITVVNNAGNSDTVTVSGLTEFCTVKVYDAQTGGTLLGTGTVKQSETSVAVSITQLGTAGGTVYVSVTEKNRRESPRKPESFSPEERTAAPSAGNIRITNRAGISDTIKVSGLSAGDVIKVYDTNTGAVMLGTAAAASGENSVLITVTQLESELIYITVTAKNKLESARTSINCPPEATTAAPSVSKITVRNNAGMADIITVTGLTKDTTVKVYNTPGGGEPIGSKTTGDYDTSVTISIIQLETAGGDLYVSLTGKYERESGRTTVHYDAELKTVFNTSKCSITIDNNAGISDTVTVTGLTKGDVINVYDAPAGGELLGTAIAGIYDSYATVIIDQLGGTEGKVYVTLTQKGKQESNRVKASFGAEPQSGEADSRDIIVTNNAGSPDTVEVNSLAGGDTVKVYSAASGGTLKGSATAGTYDSAVTITINQLGSSGGNIYISVTSVGKLEGKRVTVPFAAEIKTDPPLASNIEIVNNAGISDTINVAYLRPGDLVKVYSAATGGTLLGQGKVGSSDTEATVLITQLGETGGNVYISVTGSNKLESGRTQAAYTDELTSDAIAPENVVIENNARLTDTITITFLEQDDLIKVYSAGSGGKLLGQSTVAKNGTQTTVQISELVKTGGKVYITVTSIGKKESGRTEVAYEAEKQTVKPSANNVRIMNNAGMQDTVTAVFLDPGDIIKIYASQSAVTTLGSGTVPSNSTVVFIKIDQLGVAAGNVFVSVTSIGKLESERVQVDYSAERTSDKPDASRITVTNNANKSDTVTVTGLTEDDVVRVYDSSSGGRLLSSGTVGYGDSQVIIRLTLPGTAGGKIYVTVTSTGTVESPRTEKDYSAE